MTYFKSLLFNFLAVFFADHVIPGVDIQYYTKLPNIEGDLIFSFGLGLLNSLIFPALRFFRIKLSHFKIGWISFAISFGGYSIVNLLPVGIKIKTPGAYIWAGLVVWFCSYLSFIDQSSLYSCVDLYDGSFWWFFLSFCSIFWWNVLCK